MIRANSSKKNIKNYNEVHLYIKMYINFVNLWEMYTFVCFINSIWPKI